MTGWTLNERDLLEQVGVAFDDVNAWLAAALELRDDFLSDTAVCSNLW
jgi:hypothetical protein